MAKLRAGIKIYCDETFIIIQAYILNKENDEHNNIIAPNNFYPQRGTPKTVITLGLSF